jgi:hypothetical protein
MATSSRLRVVLAHSRSFIHTAVPVQWPVAKLPKVARGRRFSLGDHAAQRKIRIRLAPAI